MAPPPRQCGIGVPLFSIPSSSSWGIGEFADLPAFGEWCQAAGQRYVQLLPLNEISPGETSPYSSMTAMALDPIYIHVPAVEDVQALGGEAALPDEDRAALDAARVAFESVIADDPTYADAHCLFAVAAGAFFDPTDADLARAEGADCLASNPPSEIRGLVEPFLAQLDAAATTDPLGTTAP